MDDIADSIASFRNYDVLILLGDFNINLLDVSTGKYKQFMQFLSCVNLKQIVKEPTHFTDHSYSLIDVICTDTRALNVTVKHISERGHGMVLAEFMVKKDKICPRWVTYRPLKNIMVDQLNRDLDAINWDDFHKLDNINELAESFTACLITLFDLHAPTKVQKFKHPPHLWITDSIKCMMQTRDDYNIRSLDEHLTFENHVAECSRNCFYRLKLLFKIRPYLGEELRVTLCEALILSKLNYCDIVYGPCLMSKTSKLIQRVQNACARFCFHVPPRSHVTPFLDSANMMKMEARRRLHLATLLFGILDTGRPCYLYEKLVWFGDLSRFPKRKNTNIFAIPKHGTMAFRGSFKFAASKCWNDIPPPLRDLKAVKTFRNHLKKYLTTLQKQDSLRGFSR